MGYTKLFSDIVASTIWQEDKNTKILWITMLAVKDRWHVVNASIPGLAKFSNLTIAETEESLKILMAPDPYSRTKDHEGRRIKECVGGWQILNGEQYRNRMSLDERREYQRIKQREYRANVKVSTSCQQNGQQLTHTDTDTKADTDTDTKKRKKKKVSLTKVRDTQPTAEVALWARFSTFWNAYPAAGRIGQEAAKGVWRKLKPTTDDVSRWIEAVNKQAASDRWKEGFVPAISRWLSEGRWDDAIDSWQERLKQSIGEQSDDDDTQSVYRDTDTPY